MARYVSVNNNQVSNEITSISNPIILYNLEATGNDKTAYFAISNNSIIGMLIIDEVQNEYVSSYVQLNNPELNSIYASASQVAFVLKNECLVYITSQGANVLLGNNDVSLSDFNISNSSDYTFTNIINTNNVLQIANINSRSILLDRRLNVTPVSNYTLNGVGLCWAAAVAENVNYMCGTYYTALGIYNLCQSYFGGTPQGDDLWYLRAYGLCGINISITYSPINYSQIYGLLSNNTPIQVDMSRIDENNQLIGHAFVISGITVVDMPSTHAYYYISDPNESSIVCVEVSYSAMINGDYFYYAAPYGRTYTNWERTIYRNG